jgi:hypothetical protein
LVIDNPDLYILQKDIVYLKIEQNHWDEMVETFLDISHVAKRPEEVNKKWQNKKGIWQRNEGINEK